MSRDARWLMTGTRALRSRLDDFAHAARHQDATAADVALHDFEQHLVRWTEAQETVLITALTRVVIPGRDPRRELRLEFVQLRELTHFLIRQLAERIRLADLMGYIDNLERRFKAHQSGVESVYYPVAAGSLTDEEWLALEKARPD